jgi:hypothetical protein
VRERDFLGRRSKAAGKLGFVALFGLSDVEGLQAAPIAWMSGWAPSMAIIRFRL